MGVPPREKTLKRCDIVTILGPPLPPTSVKDDICCLKNKTLCLCISHFEQSGFLRIHNGLLLYFIKVHLESIIIIIIIIMEIFPHLLEWHLNKTENDALDKTLPGLASARLYHSLVTAKKRSSFYIKHIPTLHRTHYIFAQLHYRLYILF